MTTEWKWGNQGVDIVDGQLLWYQDVGAVSYASGAGSMQEFDDFLSNGPSVEGVPADVVAAVHAVLNARGYG